ncbi:hypothetical protein CHN50_01140 [Priestia aryabhattai]|uniref:hypothetical protein n=1 Tax=Bacillaceae TaxID=186817 RepID=UPI000BA01A41|nr:MULTISPECIES: hypothetical protein [Bacillaceae]MDT2047211.1 hypothetical protein [Priestia flexa]OZT14220.1 hypothetical protein CHN50_01140 [Priestia aryabhattai]TDB54967.1 hypothetical protein EPL02_01870 [Bacillus sp. CBEL-1]
MQKYLLILLTAFMLTACGTAQENSKSDDSSLSTSDQVPKERSPKESSDTSSDEQTIRLPEQMLTYENEGMQEEKMGFLKTSENQKYSLYVLEGYTFTEEEPRKDVIYYDANDALWMRIEVLPNNVDWDKIEQEAIKGLEAVSADVQKNSVTSYNEDLSFRSVYSASNDKDRTTSYLVKESDKRPAMRLTIFTPVETENVNAFLEMTRSIENL